MLQRIVLPAIFLLLCSTVKSQTQTQGWYYYTNDKGDTIRGSNDYGYRFYGERLYDINNCWCPPPTKADSIAKKRREESPFKWTKENGGFYITDSLGNYLRDATDEDWDFLKEDTATVTPTL